MNNNLFYSIADQFFLIFHVALIIFNLFGWIPEKLRRWNLVTLCLTAFSWFVLGIFYGFGYCFLTEWHWEIREAMGYRNESNSYIHFLLIELFNVKIQEEVVDIFTVVLFFAALLISVYVNLMRKKRSIPGEGRTQEPE